ncbi:MAG: hypothetical protein J0J06_08690 [Sphingomonas sp.]|uniref:hypothetical protein n=1 Tax=Sphingomonas sp. TaxID=28214 RepID=UPI001AD00A1D|nr:hypothetical protein [Sphingomonas sp.]MBN8815508.1 hypothetical protein [Sphingomonas sp.]
MKRTILLCAATLVAAGCHKEAPPPAGNEATANITALDEANLSGDANITDVPADDGDAPAEVETNAR